jgi:hypothetical protein
MGFLREIFKTVWDAFQDLPMQIILILLGAVRVGDYGGIMGGLYEGL